MSDNGNTGLMEQAASSGAKQAGSSIANRAINGIEKVGRLAFGIVWVELRGAFRQYIRKACKRYNCVKTLATGTQSRTIIGKDSIYVSIGARYNGDEVDTKTVEPLLEISKHLVIEGTGGIGKSMLLRYLFLKAAMGGRYIPVLLTLRKINKQANDEIDILQLINTCMAEFNGQLPKDQLDYSLKKGTYLFLLDGLDEVRQELAGPTVEAIQFFCANYPDNPCIITSRPRQNLMPLETFTVVQSDVLRKAQAIELASKLDPKNEKTAEFCRQLEAELFVKHKDFAENPLLLTMMFLTFRRVSSIPDHLADFYSKTFDALYSLHDSTNKWPYKREFHCKALDEPSFRNLLAYFCFQSYFHEDYEFSKDPILARKNKKKPIWNYIEEGIQKLRLSQVRAQDFIDDLCDSVCILVEEGQFYRFSHRSFQTYFAACYTMSFSDEQQKHLFSQYCFPDDGTPYIYMRLEYCDLMMQMEPHRFAVNALEPDLRSLQTQTDNSSSPEVFLLKHIYDKIYLHYDSIDFCFILNKYFIIIVLTTEYRDYIRSVPRYDSYIIRLLGKIESMKSSFYGNMFSFEQIDSSSLLTGKERTKLYAKLAKVARISDLRTAIRDWLQKLDEQRTNLQQKNSDDFLESL